MDSFFTKVHRNTDVHLNKPMAGIELRVEVHQA